MTTKSHLNTAILQILRLSAETATLVSAEIERLEQAKAELEETLSECVGNEIDPAVNVGWMRGSPGLPAYVSSLEDSLKATRAELASIHRILKDPAAVWANMLRGNIARPQAFDHYEELKQKVEMQEQQGSMP